MKCFDLKIKREDGIPVKIYIGVKKDGRYVERSAHVALRDYAAGLRRRVVELEKIIEDVHGRLWKAETADSDHEAFSHMQQALATTQDFVKPKEH